MVPGSIIVSAVLWGADAARPATRRRLHAGRRTSSLSVGLALLFTPLFTAGLGSLPPQLYSHGSAIVGTVQQVAGAAGTALFVALMSAQSAIADRPAARRW